MGYRGLGFARETGISFFSQTLNGDAAVMAHFAAQPGDYDVVIVNPHDIPTLVSAGHLSVLDEQLFAWEGYPDDIRKSSACYFDGKRYGVPVRFGCNGLIYNTEHISAEDAKSYDILWSEKVRGKVGIWDSCLPSMGIISIAAGDADAPYRLSNDQFQSLVERLKTLRPNVGEIHVRPANLIASLAKGDSWIVPAGGETLTAPLRAEGYPFDWVIPQEGGIKWMEVAVIPAQSKNPDIAMELIRWMQSPEVQGLLATQRTGFSVPCNAKALPLLPADVQDVLHAHDENELVQLFRSLRIREQPQNQSLDEWEEVWKRFRSDNLK